MPFCKTCGGFVLDGYPHKCPPAYKVFHEEYMGDESKPVCANSAEEAAERYAEQYDNGDYGLLNGEEIEVIVEDIDGERKTFICGGRTDPVYFATEKEAQDGSDNRTEG